MAKFYERGAIVWDLDDTLAHFMNPTLAELRRVMGKILYPHQLVNSQWLNDFLTKEELEEFLPHVFNPRFYADLQPTSILRKRLTPEFSALHAKYDFSVVTARRLALGRHAHRITSDWLHDQQVQVDGLVVTHPDQSKTQVMPQNTIAVVDDSATVCLSAADHGVKVFLVDQPWNWHVDEKQHTSMYRVTHENALEVMAQELL